MENSFNYPGGIKPVSTGPRKDIVEITKAILRQNKVILQMNARLLQELERPTIIVRKSPGLMKSKKALGD